MDKIRILNLFASTFLVACAGGGTPGSESMEDGSGGNASTSSGSSDIEVSFPDNTEALVINNCGRPVGFESPDANLKDQERFYNISLDQPIAVGEQLAIMGESEFVAGRYLLYTTQQKCGWAVESLVALELDASSEICLTGLVSDNTYPTYENVLLVTIGELPADVTFTATTMCP